ncbi:CBO0543 family protein [Ornithinibacillus salinisoli]|uniref:CBO0543 family protein n=1 Tax=Ornithinibacillus salinisoli TaxID=1848459 RepID=A0ABW4W5G4_9BACI
MNQEYIEITNELYRIVAEIQSIMIEEWVENVVFTGYWWLGMILSVIPWIIWGLVHNKKSRNRMLYVGFYVILISSFFDFIGVQMGLWIYYYELIPWIPAYEPWCGTLLPVIIIMLIEFRPNISPYFKGLFFAALTAFVGEPLFEHIGLYNAIHWSSFYSFPIYFLIFLFGYWLSRRNNFEKY